MRATGHHQKNNICIMRILEEEKRTENIFKARMAENCANLGREMDIHSRKTQRRPNRLYPKRATETHCNYIVKSQTRKNFNRSRRATHHIQGTTPIDYRQISQQKLCSPGENGVMYSKY